MMIIRNSYLRKNTKTEEPIQRAAEIGGERVKSVVVQIQHDCEGVTDLNWKNENKLALIKTEKKNSKNGQKNK